ncbi:hypothetical protein BC830DRAFT_1169685 [Chytriomyces sp. MP71]|nr:hypothetical protein BC830DRAFT_1169685 [Chytriomyces sp. MP71]
MKFYELSLNDESPYYGGPNGWKTHLSLLHKGLSFETVLATHWELKYELTARRGGQRTTSPAVELSDGTFLTDSFAIARWLEDTYPDAPSLFTGGDAGGAAARAVGERYARLVDVGLGDSDSEWAVWLELSVPGIAARVTKGDKNWEYFSSELKWGPGGLDGVLQKAKAGDLITRAKHNVLPFVTVLKERPGEFLQGPQPGFADFVVFGRYAMCRNNMEPTVAKEIWEDQGSEIVQWVRGIVERYPSIEKHLRPYP